MSYVIPSSFLALIVNVTIIVVGIVAIWITKRYKEKTRIILTFVLFILGIALAAVIMFPNKISVENGNFSYSGIFLNTKISKDDIDRIELYSSASTIPYNLSSRVIGIGMPGYSYGKFYVKEFKSSFIIIQSGGPTMIVVGKDRSMYAFSVSEDFLKKVSGTLQLNVK